MGELKGNYGTIIEDRWALVCLICFDRQWNESGTLLYKCGMVEFHWASIGQFLTVRARVNDWYIIGQWIELMPPWGCLTSSSCFAGCPRCASTIGDGCRLASCYSGGTMEPCNTVYPISMATSVRQSVTPRIQMLCPDSFLYIGTSCQAIPAVSFWRPATPDPDFQSM